MHRRTNLHLALVVLLLTSALGFLSALPSRAQSGNEPLISVGKNVQVSKAYPTYAHYEDTIAADPANPRNMVACSEAEIQEKPARSQYCYTTWDGGLTWESTLRLDHGELNGDPTVFYGHDNSVYIVSLSVTFDSRSPSEKPEDYTNIYHSTDAGKTWKKMSSFPLIDHEFVVVDNTKGKYDGRIYIGGQGEANAIDKGQAQAFELYASDDSGANFNHHTILGSLNTGHEGVEMGNGVVLSDGTLVWVIHQNGHDPDTYEAAKYETIKALVSSDGGETFASASTIARHPKPPRPRNEGSVTPFLAVDLSEGPFKDRVYAAWTDFETGRIEIRANYSADKGKTWSHPMVVSDDVAPLDPSNGPDQTMPMIAVNKDGVLLVGWYDRREHADNLGWDVRTAASLDGGETFSKSAKVSSASNVDTPNTPYILTPPNAYAPDGGPLHIGIANTWFFASGGHYAGLAATADGVFHPAWVDNRTKYSQIWTAPVTVQGKAYKNGSAELAAFDDVTSKVAVKFGALSYDRATNTVTANVLLRNKSKDTIHGPVKLRILSMSSSVGVPHVLGADNGVKDRGAVIDFSGTLQEGTLAPGAEGTMKQIRFQLTDIHPFWRKAVFHSDLVELDARILAHPSQ